MLKRVIATLVFLTLTLPISAQALEAYDAALIYRDIQVISNHVNQTHDGDSLESIMAPHQDVLLGEINKKIANKTVNFSEKVITITEVSATEVRVEGTFVASGSEGSHTWKNDGRNFFTFQKQENKWLLADTDFYKALGQDKSGGPDWGALLPWMLLVSALVSIWIFVLKPLQRKAISRRVWIIIATIWSFIAKLVRGSWHKYQKRRHNRKVSEPEIVEETPLEYEREDATMHDEPMESAAPAPRRPLPVPDVEVHHFQGEEDGVITEENKLEHNSEEEKD